MPDFNISTAELTDATTLSPSQIRLPFAKTDEPEGQQAKVSLLSSLIQLIIQVGAIATDAELDAAVAMLQNAIAAKSDTGHMHTAGAISGTFNETQIPNLDASKITTGTLNAAVLPALAITDTFPVTSQAEMLALTVQPGDIAIRTDLSKSFILKALPASTLANWSELLSPTSPVQSVAGRTGAITLTAADITSGAFDDARIPASIARGSEVTNAIAALSLVYQPKDTDLDAIAALSTTTFGRSLLTMADAASTRSNLKAVGSDASLFPGMTAVGQLIAGTQASYDALPQAVKDDPANTFILS